MLSLAADGVGSKWMTGALGAAPEDVLAAVGAKEGEKVRQLRQLTTQPPPRRDIDIDNVHCAGLPDRETTNLNLNLWTTQPTSTSDPCHSLSHPSS